MKRICKQCGKEFELTESEIKFYRDRGLELPKRCQSCRNQNKGAQNKGNISAKPDTASGGTPWNSGKNDNNDRNNKSYIAVAIAAAIMLVAVFLIKGLLTADSESLLISDDTVASNIQTDQEIPAETVRDAASDKSDEEQQALTSEGEDRNQEPEQEALVLESTDEEPTQTQYALSSDEQPEEQTQQDVQTQPEPQTVSESADKTYTFRKAQYLTEHFQKHGAEFPYATEEEYLQGANAVINNPNALHKLEAEDGDDVYFVESTNEFVVVSTDGFIRTYYLADIDYFNRQ